MADINGLESVAELAQDGSCRGGNPARSGSACLSTVDALVSFEVDAGEDGDLGA